MTHLSTPTVTMPLQWVARQQAGADPGIFTYFDDKVTVRMGNAAVNKDRFMDVPIVQIYAVEDYYEGRKPQVPVET